MKYPEHIDIQKSYFGFLHRCIAYTCSTCSTICRVPAYSTHCGPISSLCPPSPPSLPCMSSMLYILYILYMACIPNSLHSLVTGDLREASGCRVSGISRKVWGGCLGM